MLYVNCLSQLQIKKRSIVNLLKPTVTICLNQS
jgi:hypothetical protein